ncbi:hypothetical protein ABMA57_03815 [Saccharospirillum sp. HFRX-1]|uniref:hypothetical protein n=1 Tax=unclassified Saccharospirillum TaxID=2633430 RepID=UPI003715E10D
MQKLHIVVACLVGGLALAGCNPDEGDKDPKPRITDVGTTIRTNGDAFSTSASITVRYVAEIKDAQGDDDIVLAEITYPEGGKDIIHDTRAGASKDKLYDGLLGSSFFYSGSTPDQTGIGSVTLRVVDSDGHEATQTFSTSLLEPDESNGKEFVYSSEFSGDVTNGYPGLAVAEFEDPVGEINNSNQTITVDFSINDDRVKSLYIYFCSSFDNEISGLVELKAGTDFANDGTVNNKSYRWSDIESYESFNQFNSAFSGVQIYAMSSKLSDDGALAEQPVFSSITECAELD